MSEASEIKESTEDPTPVFSADEFYALFRQARLFILTLCAVVGVAVFITSRQEVIFSHSFTSTTDIQILPGELQLDFARRALGGAREAQVTAVSRTVSEALRSDEVLSRAVRATSEFAPAGSEVTSAVGRSGIFGRLLAWINYGGMPAGPASELERYREAIEVDVIDGTFVLRVSVTTPDPQYSAELANMIVSVSASNEREQFERLKADVRENYERSLIETEATLRDLASRQVELENANVAGAPQADLAAEIHSNTRSQEAIVQAIATLNIQIVNTDSTPTGGIGPIVLRKAYPATVPDGPTPLARGAAYAVGLFLFFVGYLIFVVLVRPFFRRGGAG